MRVPATLQQNRQLSTADSEYPHERDISGGHNPVTANRETPDELATNNHALPLGRDSTQLQVAKTGNSKTELLGVSDDIAYFMKFYAEPYSVRRCRARQFEGTKGNLSVWLGTSLFRRWIRKGQHDYQRSYALHGHGFGVAMKLPSICSRTLMLVLYASQGLEGVCSLSIRCNLSFPRSVPWNARVMSFARTGNIQGMESMFQHRQAAPSDTLPDGTSLLHVSQCSRPRLRLSFN